jgi:hypothetical protein
MKQGNSGTEFENALSRFGFSSCTARHFTKAHVFGFDFVEFPERMAIEIDITGAVFPGINGDINRSGDALTVLSGNQHRSIDGDWLPVRGNVCGAVHRIFTVDPPTHKATGDKYTRITFSSFFEFDTCWGLLEGLRWVRR